MMARQQNRRRFCKKFSYQRNEILGCLLLVIGGSLLFNGIVRQFLTTNVYLSIFGGILIIVGSMFLSHRVKGPMFRFESILDCMMSGYLDQKIQLRENDEGTDLAQKINDFNYQLSQSLRIIQHNSKAVDILIDHLATLDLPEKEKEELASLCWSMREHNRKITNNSSAFLKS